MLTRRLAVLGCCSVLTSGCRVGAIILSQPYHTFCCAFLAVNPSVPAKSVQELAVLARDPNSKLSYGSPGIGNTLHLAGELFKMRAGIDLTHVP